jgi:hypothetical protein
LLARTWWSAVKYFGVLAADVLALLAGAVAVVVVVRLDVMPGGGAGGAVFGEVVVCAKTGQAISAVAAIVLPIEAYLAIMQSLLSGHGPNDPPLARFRSVRPQKNVWRVGWQEMFRDPDLPFSGGDDGRRDRPGADICGSPW